METQKSVEQPRTTVEQKTDYEKLIDLIKSFGIEIDVPEWGGNWIRLDHSATAFEFDEKGKFKSFEGGCE